MSTRSIPILLYSLQTYDANPRKHGSASSTWRPPQAPGSSANLRRAGALPQRLTVTVQSLNKCAGYEAGLGDPPTIMMPPRAHSQCSQSARASACRDLLSHRLSGALQISQCHWPPTSATVVRDAQCWLSVWVADRMC